jgi:hypothetical protein
MPNETDASVPQQATQQDTDTDCEKCWYADTPTRQRSRLAQQQADIYAILAAF